MFTALLQKTSKKVHADIAVKGEGTFLCESCKAEVILRQGLVREEHFAHKTGSNCGYDGESMEHLRIKKSIYEPLIATLGGKVKNIEMEKHLGSVRPDIFVEGNRKKIAIEVQASALTPEQIIYRTKCYAAKDIYVLWILPSDRNRFIAFNKIRGKEMPCEFRLKEFERIISYMSFKTLIFWDITNFESRDFIVAKVDDTYTEAVEFYDKDYGGHRNFESRKIKTIKILGTTLVNVKLKDLQLSIAKEFDMPQGSYSLP
jgi:competence CoiA-like predicted nuclease